MNRAALTQRGHSRQQWLIVLAAAWSAVVFCTAAISATNTYGRGVLWFAAIPAMLTLLVLALLATHRRALGVVALALCGAVGLAVLTSFVIPLFAVLPTCALLTAAVVLDRTASRP